MTSKTRTKAIILASVCAGALSGLAIEPITNIAYRNDFGTNALVGGLTWSSTVGLGIVEGPAMPGDLDGDGLFCAVRCQTSDTHRYGKKNFYAPIYTVFSKPTVGGSGSGHTAHASFAKWGLSLDGSTTFDYEVHTGNNTEFQPFSTLDQAHDDLRYTRITNFYATAEVCYMSGGAYNSGVAGRTAAFQVDAVVLPAKRGERVYIHLNDLGTDEQTNGWTFTSGIALVENSTYDTGLDHLARYIKFPSGLGTQTATICLTAPEGRFFCKPIAIGWGYGNQGSWASRAQLDLSRDGITWDVSSTFPTGSATVSYPMTADASTLHAYDRPMTNVWLRIRLNASAGVAGVRPWAGLVTVTAEMADPKGTLITIH